MADTPKPDDNRSDHTPDATNQGVSAGQPAEGPDDAPKGDDDSPER